MICHIEWQLWGWLSHGGTVFLLDPVSLFLIQYCSSTLRGQHRITASAAHSLLDATISFPPLLIGRYFVLCLPWISCSCWEKCSSWRWRALIKFRHFEFDGCSWARWSFDVYRPPPPHKLLFPPSGLILYTHVLLKRSFNSSKTAPTCHQVIDHYRVPGFCHQLVAAQYAVRPTPPSRSWWGCLPDSIPLWSLIVAATDFTCSVLCNAAPPPPMGPINARNWKYIVKMLHCFLYCSGL